MNCCGSGCTCSRCNEAFMREAENQERNKTHEISLLVRNHERQADRRCGSERVYKYDGDCKPVMSTCNRLKGHNGNHRAISAGDKVFWK